MQQRILIVAPSWVGDMVMAQPLLTVLKRREPDAAIDVLAPGWVLALARRMPEVSETIESPFGHGQLALGMRRRLARDLGGRDYGQAIVLPNSWKSALVAWLAGIPRRTGYVGEFRYGLLNDARRLDESRLPRMVDRFVALGIAPNAPLPDPPPRPRLLADRARRLALIERLGLEIAGRVACFCPGAEYGPAKRWPSEYFAALADALRVRGFRVWLLGSAKDSDVAAAIRASAPESCDDLTGRTTLDEAVDLLAGADLVVTNDSGLMHVAAALDRPTVAIFGSSSPSFTPPLSKRAVIARRPTPCSPCFERVCPLGHFDCMRKLDPAEVLRKAEQAMTLA